LNPNKSDKVKEDSVIKIGIDLGTTNSEVAVNVNGKAEIVKNSQQDEYTPSVFGIDKATNKVVGRKAYDKLFKSSSEEEFNNNKAEVKRLMGTSEKVHFDRIDTDMSPEEVSAEILKSLKEDVKRKYPEFNTQYSVITVPAYFSSLQAEATKRAGQLAGFKYVVLLQEPIAAAIAYGFDNTKNQNWLVYDLGGGTFDVALISSKDGVLTVLAHNGNNFLGGKDFDWLIVDEVIKPAILDKYKIKDFDRSSEKLSVRSAFARLKALAETAKIELSQFDKTTIEIEDIGKELADGEDVYVSVDLTRDMFEQLIKSKVAETVDLTTKTIKEAGVQAASVSKIVLVGGPTQIPYIKQTLEHEFDLTIDNSVDPLTIVARGACLFGLSQRVPQEVLSEDHDIISGEVKVKLNYEAMTSEDEETITGVIDELKDAEQDYFIQIQAENGSYTSSKIKLKAGKFFDTVTVSKGEQSVYWLYLFDDNGNSLPVYPDQFSITHGLTVSGSPIPHTIGVIYAEKGISNDFQFKEVCDPYFDKNSVPPLSETRTYLTLTKLEKGKDNQLPIKVYEGEADVPSRNQLITTLEIDGKQLPYDLPADTEVDLKIEVDGSRTVTVEVYIPSIELTLNARADTYAQTVDVKRLEADLSAQRARLSKVKSNVPKEQYDELENSVNELSGNIKNADMDTDDKNKAERDLRQLETKLDELEHEKELPQLKSELEECFDSADELIGNLSDGKEKQRISDQIDVLRKEGNKAIQDGDKAMLGRVIQQVRDVTIRALVEDPSFWVWQLNEIKSNKSKLSNQTDGEYYIGKAETAIEQNDFEELKRCVRNLLNMLPAEEQEAISGSMAGITK
jgi:molecular chaperone DnaK